MSEISVPELLTPQEAAPLLRCHYKTVLRLIREGKLRASRYGTQQYRIRREAIVECIEATECDAYKPVTEAVTEEPRKAIASDSSAGKVSPRSGNKSKGDYSNPDWYKEIRRK